MESAIDSIISEFSDEQEKIYHAWNVITMFYIYEIFRIEFNFSSDSSLLYAKYLLGRDDFSGAGEWAEKAKAVRGHSLEVCNNLL